MKRKLAEAHEVLKSNHDVIEYLNRQLTERDLKSLPPVMAGPTVGSDRETHSTALSDLLEVVITLAPNSISFAVAF